MAAGAPRRLDQTNTGRAPTRSARRLHPTRESAIPIWNADETSPAAAADIRQSFWRTGSTAA